MGMSAGLINQLIKEGEVNTNLVSDGYHTFGELYEHRFALYIALCRLAKIEFGHWAEGAADNVWRSKVHSDGTTWDGWFILGISKAPGHQITYHLPVDKWELTEFADTLEIAPTFDGHTSDDVLERLIKYFI